MSNTKKSFLVYYDLEDQVAEFTDEQVGKLFRAMLAYARRSEETEIQDSEVRAAFRFVKVSMREDKEKYEKKCQINKDNSYKGGRLSRAE